jgi:hypothetical protein
MLVLRERTPSVHKGLADEMIYDAGKTEGYKLAIDTISDIIGLEQKRDTDASND